MALPLLLLGLFLASADAACNLTKNLIVNATYQQWGVNARVLPKFYLKDNICSLWVENRIVDVVNGRGSYAPSRPSHWGGGPPTLFKSGSSLVHLLPTGETYPAPPSGWVTLETVVDGGVNASWTNQHRGTNGDGSQLDFSSDATYLAVYPRGRGPWDGKFHVITFITTKWGAAQGAWIDIWDGKTGSNMWSHNAPPNTKAIEPFTLLAGGEFPSGIVGAFVVVEDQTEERTLYGLSSSGDIRPITVLPKLSSLIPGGWSQPALVKVSDTNLTAYDLFANSPRLTPLWSVNPSSPQGAYIFNDRYLAYWVEGGSSWQPSSLTIHVLDITTGKILSQASYPYTTTHGSVVCSDEHIYLIAENDQVKEPQVWMAAWHYEDITKPLGNYTLPARLQGTASSWTVNPTTGDLFYLDQPRLNLYGEQYADQQD